MLKNIASVLFLICFVLTSVNVTAQTLSKKEKKVLKKEIKTYKKNPEKWVEMLKFHDNQLAELNAKIDDLKAKLAAEQAEKAELAAKLKNLEMQYLTLKKNMPSTTLPDGTVYQVQMGYYEYLDLMSFNTKLKTIKAEEIDGKKRYVIGHFDNLMDAVQFSNDIKTLGISDAFVSQYIDGERNMEFDALKVLEN